jgi:predicted dehydrogenase
MTLRIAVVGYGYWGPNLARNFSETAGAELAAIVEMRPDKLAAAARRYPAARATADAASVLADPRIDAVVIATPVHTHYPLALAALRAGKHVFVEKPIAATSAQARELIDEAAHRGLTLMVDHIFVYTSAVRKMRELIDSGEVGEVQYYDSTRINLGLFQHDVNVVWDLAVHDLSILMFLLRRHPLTVSAIAACHVEGMPENVAYLTLAYTGGLIAHINVNWLSPVKVRRTLLAGTRKMVVFDDIEPSEKIKVYDRGVSITADPGKIHEMLVGYRTGDMRAPQLEAGEALQTAAHHFVDCVRDGATPVTDGRSGLAIVEILEAAVESIRRGGTPIAITPQTTDAKDTCLL